jgi:HD-GYP domain-containing protein (c-di-GMP phosphodiesterase class II)
VDLALAMDEVSADKSASEQAGSGRPRTGVWMEISYGFPGSVPPSATAVSIALHERDVATYQHCDRVARLSVLLGRACGLPARDLTLLHIAATFHDIGKIGIPDRILKKATALNAREWSVMKSHSVRSERIVLAAGFDQGETIAKAVRHHHERFDGTGYPDGLAGEEIPILSRIIAVADAYDAMLHRRYAVRRTHREIVEELLREAGRQHDPFLVETFVRLVYPGHLARKPNVARGRGRLEIPILN